MTQLVTSWLVFAVTSCFLCSSLMALNEYLGNIEQPELYQLPPIWYNITLPIASRWDEPLFYPAFICRRNRHLHRRRIAPIVTLITGRVTTKTNVIIIVTIIVVTIIIVTIIVVAIIVVAIIIVTIITFTIISTV